MTVKTGSRNVPPVARMGNGNETPIFGYRTNTTNAVRHCSLGDRELTLLTLTPTHMA
jgi:hypothetical protein